MLMPYVLGGVLSTVVLNMKQDDVMNEILSRYTILRNYLKETGEFPKLHKESNIIGMNKKSSDGVGYNVGKGYEIYICTDGDINSIMHVFLHELAHNTVTEYDHSSKFWLNLHELKEIAKHLNIYEYTEVQPFCGGTIGD
jgi:hypothetical protein